MTLADIWFVLVAVLLTGYVVLDGFDLGAGVLYPFVARSEAERAVVRAAIGPIWDGNEVWLVAGGGALFAAFPPVYATTFSGFYLAIMLFLFGLILRAVSLEFRHRETHAGWRRLWDAAFFVGSLLPALLLGCALANLVRGVPLDTEGDYAGRFVDLLNPYALLVAVTGLALLVTHGAAWLELKAEAGDLHARLRRLRRASFWVFVALLAAATAATFAAAPRATDLVLGCAAGWLFIALLAASLAWTAWRLYGGDERGGFLGSAATVVALAGIAAVGNYPEMVPARGPAAGASLTVATASSGEATLTAMLVVAAIGFPLVLLYTAWVYRVFRGKVKAADAEY